jgi:hypothetical protein
MVAVHVGHEDPPQLGDAQLTAQELAPVGLTAVEQPELSPLGQAQGHGRDVAGAVDPRTGAQKGDLHGWSVSRCRTG